MTLPPPPGPAHPYDPPSSGSTPAGAVPAGQIPPGPNPPYAGAPYPPGAYPPGPLTAGPPHAGALYPPSQGQWGFAPVPPAPPQPSGLYQAAAIINWVVMGLTILGSAGIGIFVAAWFVPMTIYIHRGAKDGYKHTGLAVCTLLFCGLISGILMLVDEGNRVPRGWR